MTYVLTVPPQSPLKRSFSDTPYPQSNSPRSAHSSRMDSCIFTAPNVSAASLVSLPPFIHGSWRQSSETISHLSASSVLHFIHRWASDDGEEERLGFSSIDASLAQDGAAQQDPPSSAVRSEGDANSLDDPAVIRSVSPTVVSRTDGAMTPSQENTISNEATPNDHVSQQHNASVEGSSETLATEKAQGHRSGPLTRWLSTLRKRNANRTHLLKQKPGEKRLPVVVPADSINNPRLRVPDAHHPKAGASDCSSIGFVRGVRSASITATNTTIAPRRDGRSVRSRRNQGLSDMSDARPSVDSGHIGRLPIVDQAAFDRAKQRGESLAELILTEESYITDMKALINVYFTFMASVPSMSMKTRRCFHRNISQIVELHEDLLAELHRIVPSAVTSQDSKPCQTQRRARHMRWRSADAVFERIHSLRAGRRERRSLDIHDAPHPQDPQQVMNTNTVGSVATTFNNFMRRFFIYEEYSAHMEAMKLDLQSTRPVIELSEYEKGTEALSIALLSLNNREASYRKGLMLSDLLIKPIQRITKYPLIFENLCKHTPVFDDPVSHAELEKALARLRETSRGINKATDSPKMRKTIETSWILQDRFMFGDKSIPRASTLRHLGHVVLCGVLHVAFDTGDCVKGQYMICALYKSGLVLATLENGVVYEVLAVLPLAGGALEESDNGQGLQCHTAPFTWKFVFERDHRLFEILMSACSAEEEIQWRRHIQGRIKAEDHEFVEGRASAEDLFSFCSLAVASIGPVFGHPESFVRSVSVQRAATVGPKTSTRQVIIKNTQVPKTIERHRSTASFAVARSRSLLSVKRVPTLVPRRVDRIRLENALTEVWSKDVLPYPAMSHRRHEMSIRASANSVMRKLSMASIASNFSKKSASTVRLNHPFPEETFSMRRKAHRAAVRKGSLPTKGRVGPRLVDFHTAPQAFLPTDFELHDRANPSRPRRFSGRVVHSENGSQRLRRMSRPSSFIQKSRSPSDVSPSNVDTCKPGYGNTFGTLPSVIGMEQGTAQTKLGQTCQENVAPSSYHHTGSFTKRLAKQRSRLFKLFG